MKIKTTKKIFTVILLLLCAGFFVTCSDPITEPGLTGAGRARTLKDQRTAITPLLSEMTEQECVAFIIKNGVEIPNAFVNRPSLGDFVKRNILAAERNPNMPPAYSWDVSYNFAERIRVVVNEYYGTAQRSSTTTRSTHTLQDSKVLTYSGAWADSGGYWHYDWDNYNCYAYAIGRIEQPREYAPQFDRNLQYQPGDFVKNGESFFDTCNTIQDLAMLVKADLEYLGFSVYITNNLSLIAPPEPQQRLICVRMNMDYEDYHFMVYNDGNWFHKPARYAPMKYNHPQPSDTIWTNEAIQRGIRIMDDISYDSEIYYIIYSNWQPLVTVDENTIKGVTIPKAGYGPATAITATHQFTGNITWKNSSGTPLGSSQTFAAGTAYTASINLSAINYTFQGLPSNFFRVFGAASSSFNAATGVLTAVFPPAKTTVGEFDIFFNDYYQVQINGSIGVFTLYTDNTWTLEETGFYSRSTSLNWIYTYPNIEDILEWTIPSSITGYLAHVDMTADIRLTVEFPANNYVLPIYGAYNMDLEVSSGGARITWKDERVNELLQFGQGTTLHMPIRALPISGRLKRFGGGDGTENKPFLITNVKHLQKIHEYDSYTTYFTLINDIDLSASYGGHIIQLPLPHFYGHFNGSGFTISNLSGYRPLTPGGGFGLFEENSGKIENLNVTGRIGVTDETRAGMIAGINRELIRNCTSRSNTRGAMIVDTNTRNSMIFDTQGFNSYAGGITGYNTGTIEECINYGDIQGKNHVGGIAGYSTNYGKVLRSYNTGSVQGNSNTGGIVGYNNTFSMVSQCYNTGEVYSNGENVGGIAGQNLYVVGNSYNTGNVSGGNYVGGIVGQNFKYTIENSYNTGYVSGGNYTGGIAGSGPNVLYCVSLGSGVSGAANVARVVSGSNLSGNRARANMIVKVSGIPITTPSNLNGIHGLDTPYNTALSAVFSGWDTDQWLIPSGNLTVNGALPTLKNMPSGIQNPKLMP